MKAMDSTVTEFPLSVAAVRQHCMCRQFIEEPTRYVILYPAGYQRDGICASKSVGDNRALGLLLVSMEQDWQASAPGYSNYIR